MGSNINKILLKNITFFEDDIFINSAPDIDKKGIEKSNNITSKRMG